MALRAQLEGRCLLRPTGVPPPVWERGLPGPAGAAPGPVARHRSSHLQRG